MLYTLTPISLTLLINSALLIFLGFYLWRRGTYYYFSLAMFAAAFWAFSGSMENGLLEISDKILWAKITYVGIYTMTPFWFLFCLQYSKFKKNILKTLSYLVWIIPIMLFSLTITNEYHGLFWTSILPIDNDITKGLLYSRGIGVYFSMVYSYLLIFLGVLALAIYAFKTTKIQRLQIFTLFIGILIPWIVNFFYLTYSPEVSQGIDLTPVAFAVTGIFAALSIFKYKLSDLIPAAKDLVYSNLEVGVIVVNNENVIVDFNPMAKKILRDNLVNGVIAEKVYLTDSLALKVIIEEGKNRIINLLESNQWLDIHISDLNDRSGHLIGKTILIYNITNQKNVEQKLEQSNKFFSDLTDFLPDPIFVLDTERKIVFWNKAMEELTGMKSEDIIGKGNYEYAIPFYGKKRPMLVDLILDNDSSSETWKLYENEKVEKEGDVITIKTYNNVLRKDGIYLWILAQPIFDNNGKIIYAIESIRDVNDIHEYQEELKTKIDELSAMNKVMVNRELKMIRLKEELNLLKTKTTSK
ncbi:MAG: histidine kinase N-terminal 7TM domain-containing protein [Candidatus Falkowbacteria bacterium]